MKRTTKAGSKPKRESTMMRTKRDVPVWFAGIDYIWRKYGLTKGPFFTEKQALSYNGANDESILKMSPKGLTVEFKRRGSSWVPVTSDKSASLWPR